MKWLAECSAEALREALRAVAPELSGYPVTVPGPAGKQDPERAVGTLTGAQLPPATTRTLRDRFPRWVRPDQRQLITGWCDWADVVLAAPGPAVRIPPGRCPPKMQPVITVMS